MAVAFAGLFMAACKDSGPLFVGSVTLTETAVTLPVSGTHQFTVVITDTDGNVLVKSPTWSIVSGGGTISQTGLFTAGTTPGTTIIAVTCFGFTANATITVTVGAAATIAVLPQTVTLFPGGTQTFTATIRDANNNVITTIMPVWTVPNPPGTIIANAGTNTAVFTAGNTLGSFGNTVSACIPTTTICDQADVIVISPPAPPALGGGFTVLGRAAVTCTLGSITPGDVGVFQAAGAMDPACAGITAPGVAHAPGDAATVTAYNNFLTAYIARTFQSGDCDAAHILTGSLAGITLAPGVWCFDAGATLTGLLTLNGPSTGLWLFKIGTTAGTGSLAGTNFIVTMAGAALPCNVTWWVRDAATMTTSDLKGTVLAGTAISLTGGTFNGNAWAGASGIGDATITGTAVTGCP